MTKKPRKYQIESINAITSKLEQGVDKQLLCLATGAGKTFTAVNIANRFKSVLFVVDSEELLEQAAFAFLREKFDSSFLKHIQESGFVDYVRGGGLFAGNEYKVGLIKADVFQPHGNVVFCSAQTLHRRIDRLDPNMYDLVIIDECHVFLSKSYFKGVTHFTPKLRLGLTATPYRLDGLPLSDLFSEIVYEYNIDSGIKDGYLVELNAIKVSTNCSLDSVKTLGGEFNQRDLSNEINTLARNNHIAESYLKYANGRKTLGFGIDIQHCLDLVEAFKEKGINASAVSSDEERTGSREQKIKDFKEGRLDVLFNTNILTKGFDEPSVSCIITAAPTKSLARFLQCLGRGTRTLPGTIDGLETPEERIAAINKSAKKDCIILDITDVTTKHSVINCWEIDKQKPIEDRIFVSRENKEKLLLERLKRNVKLQHSRTDDEKVNLLSLPKIKINKSWRMEGDATPAQLAAIAKWGYDIENTHYSKTMVAEIFGKQECTDKQKKYLAWKGYDVSGFVSVEVASAAFKEIKEKEAKEQMKNKNEQIIKNNPFKF
jgi:superfamily II DNA or RNA helicase